MKRLATYAAAVCAVVTLAAAAWMWRDLVFGIAAAWALAASMRGPIEALRQRGVPARLAIAATYVVALVIVVFAVVVIGGPLPGELGRGIDQLSAAYERLLGRWEHGSGVERNVAAVLPDPRALVARIAEMRPTELASSALTAGAAVVSAAAQVIILVALSVYWCIYRDSFRARVLFLVPARGRGLARRALEGMEDGVGRHVLAEATKSVLTIGVLALSFRALHVELPTLPAVFVGIVRIVPFAGFGLGVTAAALSASGGGVVAALLAGGVTAAWLPFVDRFLVARLLAARSYNPVLTVVIIVSLVPLWGWAGLVAAPAVAAAVQILLEVTVFSAPRVRPRLGDVDGVREAFVALQARASQAPVSPEVHGLLHRLGRLCESLPAKRGRGSAGRAA